jgi:hypothetical protein
MHDVLWNHSLCQLKDLVEAVEEAPEGTRPALPLPGSAGALTAPYRGVPENSARLDSHR